MNTHEQRHRGANLDDNTLFTANVFLNESRLQNYLEFFMMLVSRSTSSWKEP